ncbi:hypothetical protein J4216_04695 [Candidatus Woesearchaeota archaeon]|nr:hypothetical protein [Candidatus Woesearchaeota archaeon]
MAKGVIYTLNFFLLGMLLIAMALLVFNISQSTQTRTTELSISNRVNDLSSSISKSIVDIFILDGALNVTLVNNTISIQEIIPHPNSTNYTASFNNLKEFVESREKNVKINNTNLDAKILNINNMLYYKDTNAGSSSSERRYVTNFTNIKNITIDVFSENILLEEIEWDDFTSGNVPINLIFRNSTHTLTDTKNVNINQEIHAEFDRFSLDDIDIEINEESPNLFEIRDLRNGTFMVNITLTIDTTDKIKVFLENPINISFPEFNITKSTKPKIL